MSRSNELDKLLFMQAEKNFFHESIANENTVILYIIMGDTEKIIENRRRFPSGKQDNKGTLSDNPVRNQIYHLVVFAALISRACISAGMSPEKAYTISDIYIRRADKCKSVREVMNLNDEMVLEYAGEMKRIRRPRNISAPVKKAIELIDENSSTHITVSEIADAVGYNRSHLYRLFRQEIGMSMQKYINSMRINSAKSMLRDSTLPITRISQSLGFTSQSYFTKVFKAAVGVTPNVYRKGNSK